MSIIVGHERGCAGGRVLARPLIDCAAGAVQPPDELGSYFPSRPLPGGARAPSLPAQFQLVTRTRSSAIYHRAAALSQQRGGRRAIEFARWER